MSLTDGLHPLRGIVPPLVTPLTDEGLLDRPAFERLIEHVLAGGVNGLFVLGTTGEGPALPYAVRTSVVEAACEVVGKRVPVLVGVSDTSLGESIEMADVAAQAGADAVVYAPPSYFPLLPSDLDAAARRLANESPLPVLLYNIPSLTGTAFAVDTVGALTSEPNIVGLKDSSGDLDYFRRVLPVCRRRSDWSVLIGAESLLATATGLGADGGVCGGANIFPELFVDLFIAAEARDQYRLNALQQQVERLSRLYELSRCDGIAVIQGVKAALSVMGLCSAKLCPPYPALRAAECRAVASVVEQVRTNVVRQPATTDSPLATN